MKNLILLAAFVLCSCATTETQILHISDTFSPGVQAWDEDIVRWSQEYDLDPDLIAVVMELESGGDVNYRGGRGQLGLFGIMPYWFMRNQNPLDPDTNASVALPYLVKCYTMAGGDIRITLIGNNGGVGAIGRNELALAQETIDYASLGEYLYNERNP